MSIDFTAEAVPLAEELVAIRRYLHQIPELGLELPQTQAKVVEELADLPVEIHKGEGLDSVVAILRGGRPGPRVLLRGDMDALPVAEETGLDFASVNGRMHACGHDLHVTGLLGAAKLLSAHQAELPGTVLFMFQPGEEGPGGAQPMIDEGMLGMLDGPIDAAYAIHVGAGERGVFNTRPGTIMAGANQLHVTFHGRGGHASQPSKSIDPVRPTVEFAQALNAAVTSSFSVFDPVVASVTQLHGGDAVNVIPPSAGVGVSVRTLSAQSTELFPQVATRLAESIATAHGCTAEVDWQVQYPVTVNDEAEARFALDTLTGVFGPERVVESPDPLMGSEDFSLVLNEVPGAFVFFQIAPADVDPETGPANHSPLVRFDDSYLPDQAAALATLAWERLSR